MLTSDLGGTAHQPRLTSAVCHAGPKDAKSPAVATALPTAAAPEPTTTTTPQPSVVLLVLLG